MAKRIITKIGDVFCAVLDSKHKKYFQYIANDSSQLNSSVIRVFRTAYNINEDVDLNIVVQDAIDFHAHVVLKWGIEGGFWQKVGGIEYTDYSNDVYFRMFRDWEPNEKASEDWYIWKIGEEEQFIGKLIDKYRSIDIGSVLPGESIIYRMRTGKYLGKYPS